MRSGLVVVISMIIWTFPECEAGKWGLECRNDCGKCLSSPCYHITGVCEDGCAVGYKPDTECKTGDIFQNFYLKIRCVLTEVQNLSMALNEFLANILYFWHKYNIVCVILNLIDNKIQIM